MSRIEQIREQLLALQHSMEKLESSQLKAEYGQRKIGDYTQNSGQ